MGSARLPPRADAARPVPVGARPAEGPPRWRAPWRRSSPSTGDGAASAT